MLQGHTVPQDALATLGDRFEQLPEGWSFRVSTPTQDLRMSLPPAEAIPSVQDEFNQIYRRIPETD